MLLLCNVLSLLQLNFVYYCSEMYFSQTTFLPENFTEITMVLIQFVEWGFHAATPPSKPLTLNLIHRSTLTCYLTDYSMHDGVMWLQYIPHDIHRFCCSYVMNLCDLCRDHFGYRLSQWETMLQCNIVPHWLSPYPEWSLFKWQLSKYVNSISYKICTQFCYALFVVVILSVLVDSYDTFNHIH